MSDLPPQLKPDIAIQDAVHGRIWLTTVERRVVNTAEFQRLRRISQLGLATFVFPSADHSRFIHSLGATHVMGWMLRQAELQRHLQDARELVQCLRLAALLHDVGHYPFSHLGENVWGAASRGAIELYASEDADRALYDVAADVERDSRTSHEAVTAAVIASSELSAIIDAELGAVDGRPASEIVVAIIDGSYPDLVCQNLVSSDLDCDRLDYLIRDSLAAGLTYGLVDLAYLIENLVVAEDERSGQKMIAIDKAHGAQAVEHYVLARYYHYAQFITHKTIMSAELILAAAVLELIRLEKLPSADDVMASIGRSSFLSLTDATVWDLLASALTESWASVELREAAERLLHRDLLKIAYRLDSLEEELSVVGDRLDRLFMPGPTKDRMATEAGVTPERFCYKKQTVALVGIAATSTPTRILRDREEVEARWVKTVKVADPGGQPQLLVEQPGLLGELSKRRWVTRRVLVREATQHADRSDRPVCDALAALAEREIAT